ncbi:MAG: zinc ribbon domain-containing protein [Candidatus Nitrosocosmicus sp.]|nr:zinc ribbon domain-containing protein [Candidatus Nitrosocosmicus sp.]MDN5866837.1 zinc ribbon domain-containing protein [Candidatus Nitrosocosmicus sp.]
MTFRRGYNKQGDPNTLAAKFNPMLFEKPIIGSNLLEIYTYDIEVQKGLDNPSELNMMEVRPIELDATILFYNKKSRTGISIPISIIREVRTINQMKGSFRKKLDQLIEIELDDRSNNLILFNIKDNKIDEFRHQVYIILKTLHDDVFWTFRVLKFNTEGVITTPVEIYPMAPFLSPGEEIVWNNIKTKGIINKKIAWLDLITNYRIYQYDFVNHSGKVVLISAIEDVVVGNQRRISDSYLYGSYAKSRDAASGYGKTKTTSTAIGDISIFALGKPYIVFKEISDPSGVTKLIKSLKYQCNFIMDTNPSIQDNETVLDDTHDYTFDKFETVLSKNDEIICSNCKKGNIKNSKFCSHCGAKYNTERKCNRCSNVNLPDAVFCNRCGNRLNF